MQNIYFSTQAGNQVCGLLAIPPGASSIVVMSHGFTSSKDSRIYAELQEMLNKAGMGTLRYDYYGHGESDGNFEDITLQKAFASIDAAVAMVKRKGDYRIGLLGASFGGLLSILKASLDPDKVNALALKSPVTDLVEFWKNRVGESGIEKWKGEGVLHYDDLGEKYDLKYGFWEAMQGYHDKVPKFAEMKIKCPSLVVHGDADVVVPIGPSRKFAELIGAKFHVVEGADHAYSNKEHYEECKRVMVDFLAENLTQQN